ncbi:MAG: hypothetical protein ACP5MD_00775, partial [Verrucomicrobiia bacterium]
LYQSAWLDAEGRLDILTPLDRGRSSCVPCFSLAGLGWSWCCRPPQRLSFALWAVVFVAATWIAYFRCKKRGEDFAQSVYELFMTGATGKPPTDK